MRGQNNFPSMKRTILACNWKMNLTLDAMERLIVSADRAYHGKDDRLEVVLCPSHTTLHSVHDKLALSKIQLGAQDVFWQSEGAYTGAVSPPMLVEAGCRFVILGHSERRKHFGETNETVNKKVHASLAHGLTPIICVGETFEERQNGSKDAVIMAQVQGALQGVSEFERLLIAYEPVWVIGSGEAIQPNEAADCMMNISYTLRDIFSEEIIRDRIQLLYGGSVDPTNIRGFVDEPTIDGVLVGGASMDEAKLFAMIETCA